MDITKEAVENTKENMNLHGFSNISSVYLSDVYSSIPKEEKFDVIFWNIPFLWQEKENISDFERTMFDKDYLAVKRYI